METIAYSPLKLFSNFQEAANATPDVPIIFDQPLAAFPELGFKSTYKDTCQHVLTRAYQLAHLGVGLGDKVMIYKSSAFDTYLLAVATAYLGAGTSNDLLSLPYPHFRSLCRPFRRSIYPF